MRRSRLRLGFVAAVAAVPVALAAAGAGEVTKRKTATIPDPPMGGAVGKAAARCPGGMHPVLGEIKVTTEGTTPQAHALGLTGKGRKMVATALSYSATTDKVTSIAHCDDAPALEIRKRSKTVGELQPDDDAATVKASCRSGENLVYGGFAVRNAGGDFDAYPSESRRLGSRSWQAGTFNFLEEAKLIAYAFCSNRAPRASSSKRTVTIGGGARGSARAKCDRREELAYGGWKADVTYQDAFVLMRAMRVRGGDSWKVKAKNDNGSNAGSLTAFAYCT